MKGSDASAPGSGFSPESGPGSGPGSGRDSVFESGSANTASGSAGGYGPGGPLGGEATWTAPTGPGAPTNPADPAAPEVALEVALEVASTGSGAPVPLTGQVSVAAMATLNAGQTVNLLKTLSALRSWVDAQEAKAATHLHDLMAEEHPWAEDLDRIHALAGSEISAALRIPERTAGFLLDTSELLTREYPATLRALEDGRLSQRHATAVVQEAISIPNTVPAVTAAFEAHLIGLACQTTVAKFTRQAQRLREALHPESTTLRRRKALQDRRVYLDPAQDGMAWLQAFLPTEQAAGIFHRVDTAARNLQGPDETRTLTQLRADVLVDVLTSAGPTGYMSHAPDPSANPAAAAGVDRRGLGTASQPGEASTYWGVQAKVFVTVPVMTLLGGDTPGELEGYGPIDPETARKLAGHAPSFTRILTHPFTGARLGADATTYRVPQDLKDAVRVRDGTCRHPGCNRLAVFCELDHTTPWSQGGKTSYGNLAALCKRHHMFKTEGYWHYQQPEPGTIIAISPLGETYLTTADPPPAPPAPPPDIPPPF
ncbi:HNH endonuclease signature motif containing protein [Arthrobacter sp. TMT4-20]